MVIVSTTMSTIVKRIIGCGPLSQVSQPEITLPVTAPLECRNVCPKCHKCHNCHNHSISSCFTSAAKKIHYIMQGICKLSTCAPASIQEPRSRSPGAVHQMV